MLESFKGFKDYMKYHAEIQYDMNSSCWTWKSFKTYFDNKICIETGYAPSEDLAISRAKKSCKKYIQYHKMLRETKKIVKFDDL